MARFACDTAWHELIDGGVAIANAMLDARQEGDSYRRVEGITRQRWRRRWTGEEKARIVAESFEEGANISEVARRNGVARGLLTVWRGQVAAAVAGKAPSFVRKPLAPNRGEPRESSAKMGTIASPCHYEAAANSPLRASKLRRPAMRHFASTTIASRGASTNSPVPSRCRHRYCCGPRTRRRTCPGRSHRWRGEARHRPRRARNPSPAPRR